RYADMLAEKFRILRGGAKPSEKPAEKPVDRTTLAQVNEQAKKNNEPTAVTTREMRQAAADAIKAKKYQLAADYLEKLTTADPENAVDYLGKRGAIYIDYLKDYKKAIEVSEAVIKASPQEPAGYYNRGTAYLNMKEWKKARKDLDKAIELKPTWME